jgi:adenylate cyclase
MTIDPFLRISAEAGARHVPLPPLAVVRIGRAEHNDVVLTDGAASREHAMIRRDGDGACVLVDSGSRNGTTLNGRAVTAPQRLKDGDTVAVGRQQLHFHDPAGAAERLAEQTSRTPQGGGDATQFLSEQALITVLVVDIRNYTALSREVGEARISALMTAVFRRAGTLLDAAGAWSQKFIGDAIMAVWRHPHDRILSSELADIVGVVGDLQRLLGELGHRFDLPRPLTFGAGVNTGLASLGNMGSASAADFTALGDAVNKAFRLETATKALGCDVAIGEATLAALVPPLPPALLPPQADAIVKGYDAPEPVRTLRFADLPRMSGLLTGQA